MVSTEKSLFKSKEGVNLKIIWTLLAMDILLILSGVGWLVFAPINSSQLIAFNRPVSPEFLGTFIILFGLYQSFRLRRAYLKVVKRQKAII